MALLCPVDAGPYLIVFPNPVALSSKWLPNGSSGASDTMNSLLFRDYGLFLNERPLATPRIGMPFMDAADMAEVDEGLVDACV